MRMDSEYIFIPTSIDNVVGNYDLLMEILLRLPAKSLLRFMSVCKNWQSMISTTWFRHRHTLHIHRIKPLPSFILGGNNSQYFICDLTTKRLTPLKLKFDVVKILNSCNGLLLLACGRHSTDTWKRHYVFNPTTGQLRELSMKRPTSNIFLVFDPSESPYYKVVCFRREKSLAFTESYDSKTHSWKRGVELTHSHNIFNNGIYWNGDIYFIRARGDSYRFVLDDGFHKVSSPPHRYCHGSTKTCVMESNGHMHCVTFTPRPFYAPVSVLEMNEVGIWFKKYGADFRTTPIGFYREPPPMDFLGIIRGETERDSMLLFKVPDKIMIYRFYNHSSEVFLDMTTSEDLKQIGKVRFDISHPFIQTLALV